MRPKMRCESNVEPKGKKARLMGGLILIVLGVLIILNTLEIYEFSKSWPLLLIVMSAAMLIRRVNDWGGWFIGIIGIVFFAKGNFGAEIQQAMVFIAPILLILAGLYLLFDYIRSARKGSRQ